MCVTTSNMVILHHRHKWRWVTQHVMEVWSGLKLNIVDSAVGE